MTDIPKSNADILENLPSDKLEPSNEELSIIHSLFKKKENKIKIILYSLKNIFIAGFLFIILSLPVFDTILNKIFPFTQKSAYLSLIVKAVIFMIIYYIITNINTIIK